VATIAGYWSRLSGVEKIFLAFLLFTQGYYFYRYAFQIQSHLAPAEYAPTPEAYQYPKYVVAAAMLALLTVIFLSHRETARHLVGRLRREPVWLLLISFSLYCALSTLKFSAEASELGHVAKFIFVIPFALTAAVIWRSKDPVPFFVLFLGASLIYHAAYEGLMLANFELTGRLPALTFSRLIPRYGAGWDDPNGFAAFAVLCLIGLLFIRPSRTGWKAVQLTLVGVLTLFVALAYSMTAAGGLLLGLGLLLVLRRLDVTKIAIMAVPVTVVAIGLLASGHIDVIIDGKLRSIDAHTRTKAVEPTPTIAVQSSTPAPQPSTPPSIDQPSTGQSAPSAVGHQGQPSTDGQSRSQSIGTPAVAATGTQTGESVASGVLRVLVGRWDHIHFHETIYLLVFVNFGLLGLCMFVGAMAMTLHRALKQWRAGGAWADAYLLGAIVLTVFLTMNLFLPLFAVFPVNLYVWLLVGLIWARPNPGVMSAEAT
jgi:hypothetical protein